VNDQNNVTGDSSTFYEHQWIDILAGLLAKMCPGPKSLKKE